VPRPSRKIGTSFCSTVPGTTGTGKAPGPGRPATGPAAPDAAARCARHQNPPAASTKIRTSTSQTGPAPRFWALACGSALGNGLGEAPDERPSSVPLGAFWLMMFAQGSTLSQRLPVTSRPEPASPRRLLYHDVKN